MIKVFFDASVIFSAIYSDCGASFKLISLVKTGVIIGITSETVINEVSDNIAKFKHIGISEIERFITNSNFLVRERITEDEILPFANIVELKDAHVLAGAILTNCSYLVTLDKKHLDNSQIKSKIKKIMIFPPGMLLQMMSETDEGSAESHG